MTITAELWVELHTNIEASLSSNLTTILSYDHTNSRMSRVYSTREDINPLGGFKPVIDSPFSNLVLKEGKIWYDPMLEAIKGVVPGQEVMEQISCNSLVVVPVMRDSICIGTLSIGSDQHWFGSDDADLLQKYAEVAAPLIELAHCS